MTLANFLGTVAPMTQPNAPLAVFGQPHEDALTEALSRLVSTLGEDALFVFSSGERKAKEALEGIAKRRTEAYVAVLRGVGVPRLSNDQDAWVVELCRATAAVAPPQWLPMHEILEEKVTLEVGARGLRSLFSSKPSDKDVQRVKRLGTFVTRALKAVLAADGPLDAEELRIVTALVGSFGLPEEDARTLVSEAVVPASQLDVYGDVEPAVARGILRGAWLAAADDALDPREEEVVKVLARKLVLEGDIVEAERASVLAQIETRRMAGVAVVDAVRFLLSDRVPGIGVQLAALAGRLLMPRRYREEVLAQVGHGTTVTLSRRHESLIHEDRQAVLGMAWAAALTEDPSVARKTLLRWRYDRLAADLGADGTPARELVEDWIDETLATMARTVQK